MNLQLKYPNILTDPAIIIRSFQVTHINDNHEYTGGSAGSRGTNHRYAHPIASAGSSPDTQRKKDIMESPSWRRGGGSFVQESAAQPDPFTTPEAPTQAIQGKSPTSHSTSLSDDNTAHIPRNDRGLTMFFVESVGTLQFRPREDRVGLQIDGDNAQAVLPPNACVFVAK